MIALRRPATTRPAARRAPRLTQQLRICSDEPLSVFYHATPTKNLPGILLQGLRPGRGQNWGYATATNWSANKVFLARGYKNAWEWRNLLMDETGEYCVILVLDIPTTWVRQARLDTLAAQDQDLCAFYLRRPVPARYITDVLQ